MNAIIQVTLNKTFRDDLTWSDNFTSLFHRLMKRCSSKFLIGEGSLAGFPNSLSYHYLNETIEVHSMTYFVAYFYILFTSQKSTKYFVQVGKIGVFSRPWFLMKMAPLYHHWLDLINLDLGQGQLWHRSPWNTFEMNLCIVKHETFFMHHPVQT